MRHGQHLFHHLYPPFTPEVETHHMCQIRHQLPGVLETPATDIQSLRLPSHQFLWVERWIPSLELDITEDNILYITIDWPGWDGVC